MSKRIRKRCVFHGRKSDSWSNPLNWWNGMQPVEDDDVEVRSGTLRDDSEHPCRLHVVYIHPGANEVGFIGRTDRLIHTLYDYRELHKESGR